MFQNRYCKSVQTKGLQHCKAFIKVRPNLGMEPRTPKAIDSLAQNTPILLLKKNLLLNEQGCSYGFEIGGVLLQWALES